MEGSSGKCRFDGSLYKEFNFAKSAILYIIDGAPCDSGYILKKLTNLDAETEAEVMFELKRIKEEGREESMQALLGSGAIIQAEAN